MTNNNIDKENGIDGINQKLTTKIFGEEGCSYKKEQVKLLSNSFLSHKENRRNIMYENINKNNIGWDSLKNQKVTFDILKNYQPKDDLPLEIQDAIMREIAGKILANLDSYDKEKFDEEFDLILLRSHKKMDIKTLEKFEPYTKLIDKTKLYASNEEIVGFLNDNKVTNINPVNKIEKWSLYDQTVFLELLNLENKDHFDKQNAIESSELAKVKFFLKVPNLDNRKDSKGGIEKEKQKILEKMNYEKVDVENNIKDLEAKIAEAKTKGDKDEIDYLKSLLGLELGALDDMKLEDKRIDKISNEIKDIDNVEGFEKILENKKSEYSKIEILEKKCKDKTKKIEYNNKLDVLDKEVRFLETIRENLSTKQDIEGYIDEIKSSGILETFKIDEKGIVDFTKKLYKLGDKEKQISIPSNYHGKLNFAMKKSFDENDSVNIEIDLNKSDKGTVEWIEDSKNYLTNENINKNGMFYSVLSQGNDIRLADGYKIKVDGKDEGYLDSSVDSFDEDLRDIDTEDYPNMFDEEGEIKAHVSILCDASGVKIKDNDGKYIFINHNKCDRKIEVIDKKIIIKGDQTDILMHMFVARNKQAPGAKGMKKILHIDEHDQENLMEDIFEELLSDENDIELNSDGNTVNKKINIGEPSREEIIANSGLDDDERLERARELLEKIANENGIEISSDLFESGLLDVVLFAHYSTVIDEKDYQKLDNKSKDNYLKLGDKYYEMGEDGERVAGVYNYTKKQLKEKIKILQSKVGFENWQIKALLKYGLCGVDPDAVQDKAKGEKMADEWIQNNKDYYESEGLSHDDAFDEAIGEYEKLGKKGKKAFIDTLEKTDTGIEEVDKFKSDIVEDLKGFEAQENKNTSTKTGGRTSEENNITDETEKEGKTIDEETEEEKFEKKWEDIPGYKFQGTTHGGFIPGTRLMIDMGGSTLPPDDVEASFLELEIVDISDPKYFRVKVIGADVKTDMDGRIVRLPKNAEQLKTMGDGGMFKMPAGNRGSWKDCLSTIEKTQMFDKISVFGTGPTQTILKGGKFINGKGEEVTHFSRTVETYDMIKDNGDIKEDEMGQTSMVTTYKVTPLKNGKVKVSCNFTGQDKKDFTKDVRYKHEKVMDYTSFMVLMESKQLYGKTKEETGKIDIAQTGERDPMKGNKVRFFSIMSMINSVQTVGKNINGKIEEYQKEQAEDVEHALCSHEGLNLYGKMGSFFGAFGGLFEGMENSLQTAGLEYYADREGRTWKKIEKRLTLFEKDPHFSTQWKEKLGPMLEKEGPIGGHNDFNRYQYAAAFLYLLKKDGPWSRILFKKMGKGFWVEKFLGPKHAKRFLEMQEKRKNELEEYKKLNIVHRRQPRQTELSRLEFDYLTGVIDGRQPFGGIPGDDEMYQASKWGRTFAEKIGEGADEYFGGFEEKYKKIGRISFRQAEQEWFRHMANFRPHKALPFLKAMVVNAQSGAEEDRAKAAILGGMLTGVFKNMQDHNLRSEFWKISRTMGFLPGLWVRDTEHQENVAKMLDGITSHKPFTKTFSEETGYKIGDFQIDNFESEKRLPFLLNTFPRYWKSNGKKILEILQFQNRDDKNSIINLAETGPDAGIFKFLLNKSREEIKEDIDQDVAGTYGFYEHSPLTANKGIVSQVMPTRGKFEQSDNNMKEAAQQFWTSVGKNDNNMIPTTRVSRGSTEFIFGKYFNWLEDQVFTQGNLAFLIRGLSLVKQLKQEGKHEEANYYLWYTVYGNVLAHMGGFPTEFAQAMGRFLTFFEKNVDQIDDHMIANVCNGNREAIGYFKKPFEALNMKTFWKEYMSQTTGAKKSKYKRDNGEDPDMYINWQIDNVYKKLNTLNIGGLPSTFDLPDDDDISKQLLDNLEGNGKTIKMDNRPEEQKRSKIAA